MRPAPLALAAIVPLALAIWFGLKSIGPPAERTAGVSRDAAGRVQLNFVLCGGQRVHFVRFLDYGESYGNGQIGPVMWQIRSRRGAALHRVAAGRVPAGFEEEENRLPLPGPSGRTVVTDPHGDDIMSFLMADLRRGRIYRADYVYLAPREFERRGQRDCPARLRAHRYTLAAEGSLAVAGIGFGAALVARIRREREKTRAPTG